MKRGFLARVAKIKDDGSIVLTQREILGIPGVCSASLAQLEDLAGLPSQRRRIGYTSAEVLRRALQLLLTRPGEARAGKGES
ncbi:MAG TPA: hypothetical protein DCZ01_07475 [Elusimicrobia bacterium]|nr:MAG: hypothetical protein A2X37_06490 [Elusimicrobia bacterium GWA2_66_18]HAZ08345.1 hypothetical protein [Elusimicrobiota bacterium]